MSFDEIKNVKWHFPPSKSRSGNTRGPYDIKHIIVIQSDLFPKPTIATSDLHSWTNDVFHLLDDHIKLKDFTVICAGDMAGQPIFGVDGNPTDYYVYMYKKCKELYFVQGNHDRPDIRKRDIKLRNENNKFCDLEQNKGIVKTSIGKIAGVHGTISEKRHPFKKYESDYLRGVSKLLKQKPDILVTHETPEIPLDPKKHRYPQTTGNSKLYTLTKQHKPKIHIYGHCHHLDYNMKTHCHDSNGVVYLNVDARVLIFIPPTTQLEDILKKELEDMWILDPLCNYDCWTLASNNMVELDNEVVQVKDKTSRNREFEWKSNDFPTLH